MFRLFVMVKLASVAVGAIEVVVEVFALLCSIICRNMRFYEELMFTVRKCTFSSELAFTYFPTSTYFCFKFLLKIILRRHVLPRLYRFNFWVKWKSSIIAVVCIEILFFIILVKLWSLCFSVISVLNALMSWWTIRRKCSKETRFIFII